MEFKHIPVMLTEVIDNLSIKTDGIYVDCTIGGAGHSIEIAKRLKTGKLYGFDRDQDAVNASKLKLKDYENQVEVIKANFKDAPQILQEKGVHHVDGVLIDLGVSSYQIDEGQRGFSFLHDGKLDMRMDREDQTLTAYEIVNNYSESALVELFFKYGEEEFSKAIAKNIVKLRQIHPIETTFELRDIIENSMPKKVVFNRNGASKKVFQALRIEVNGELLGLDKLLKEFIQMLNPGGRLAVLTFHSLEDRIVKTVFKEESTNCICPPKTPICICGHKATVNLVNKKPIVANEKEIEQNSRSTCAKLRVVEKI